MTSGSHIELFGGVGMTGCAAEAFGFRTVATAETVPFCRSVLIARHPQAAHLTDVRHVTPISPLATIRRPLLVSGGWPCQDVSDSGTGLGLDGDRSGLWREFARVIHEFRPEYVLGENSARLRTRGLHKVLCDLGDLGYDARWDCIPAAAVGAPHLRDRIFITAIPSPGSFGPQGDKLIGVAVTGGVMAEGKPVTRFPRAGYMIDGVVYEGTPVATVRDSKLGHLARNSDVAERRYPTPTTSDGSGGPGTTPKREGGKNLRTVINELEGNGRLNPDWVEWMMGLPIGWTNPLVPNAHLQLHPGWRREPRWLPRTVAHNVPNRAKRIRALGNGLVPQTAEVALGWMFPEGAIR